MQRLEAWPERLHALIEQRLHVPFAWGSNDCAIFAADAVQAVTGVDLAERFRGQYTTESGALGVDVQGLSEDAHILLWRGDIALALLEMADECLDGEVRPLMARRGDIVLAQHDNGHSLAVCVGAAAAAPGRRGLMMLPPEHWIKSWRVG